MVKSVYLWLSIAVAAIVTLSSCNGSQTTENAATLGSSSTPQSVETMNHSAHGAGAKININSAILSELDKIEALLGVPALSNKIQAARPYSSPQELVSKKVMNQEQFDKIKDLVTIEDVKLTGVAKDVDYMVKLGLMKGHLYVAKELLDQNQPKQAEPHIGHPVEEIYVDLEEQLNERKVKEFKTTLSNLQDLVKSTPNNAKVKTDYTASIQGVDNAIAALSTEQRSKPAFALQVINGLLDTANSEYGAAVADGKIGAIIEYQDSRGFVTYANELYKGITTEMAKENPEVDKAVTTNLAELTKNWPTAIAPTKPVKTTEEVGKLIKTIEQDSQKVIIASK